MSTKLLRHSKPYEYESLGSYLYRVCLENAIPFSWMCNILSISTNTNGINFNYNTKTLALIAEITDNSINDIRNLTIHRFSDGLWPIKDGYSAYSGFSVTVSKTGSKYCPLCRNEANYQRIFWQLNPIQICNIHKTYLIHKCSNCGNHIYSNNIISGECTCGQKLADIEVKRCTCDYVLRCQERIYRIFNIPFPDKYQHIGDYDYLNIPYDIYERFTWFLEGITGSESEIITSFYKYKGIDEYCKKIESTELKLQIYAEYLFSDWPYNLYCFLDYINENATLLNPRYDIITPFKGIINLRNAILNNSSLYEAIWTYFLDNFNIKFFRRNLSPYIINNEYIPVDIAAKCFYISKRSIIEHYNMSVINNCEYVSVNDLIDTIITFIKNSEIYKNEDGFCNLEHFKRYRVASNIVFELYKYIPQKSIQIKIDPFEEGFNMIYFDMNIANNFLNKRLLDS
jgi:hypothetical protein